MSTEASEDEYVVSLGDLLRVVWSRLWVILLVTSMLTGAVTGFSLAQTPMYDASIKILMGQKQGTGTPGSLGGDVMGLQQITQTMVEGVSSRPVAEDVIRQENLRISRKNFLEERLSVQQVRDTQFIKVDYRDPSPQRAHRVANAIGEVFSEQVSKVSPSANAITATVWEPAVVPDEPVSPNPVRNSLLALVLGLMLGVGLAFVLELLDDSWRSPDELEQISGAPTFGVIPYFDVSKSK